MSLRYPGGLVRKTPLTLNPALGNAANGVFKLSEAMTAVKNGTWPAYDPYFENTTLLLHGDGTNGAQNNTFLDSSTNNFTITRNGNTTQGTFSPFSQTGWSNYFDGDADVIYATETSSQFTFGTGDYEYSAWINTNSPLGTQQTIFGRDNTGNTSVPYIYIVSGSGTVALYYSTNIVVGTTVLAANTWYYITVSRVSGTTRLFINGVLDGSASDTTNLTAAGKLVIGGQWTGNTNMFRGYISNARVVKGAGVSSAFTPPTTPLTAISGTSLLTCQSNRFRDASTNNFAITVNGNTSVQAFSPFAPTAAYSAATVGGSGYFDGSGDYLTLGTASGLDFGSDAWTLQFWVYITEDTGSEQYIITSGNSSWQAGAVAVHYSPSSNAIGILANSYDSGGSYLCSGSYTRGQWAHFAFTRSGNTITCYKNGVSAGTQTSSITWNFNNNNATSIGKVGWSTGYVKGYIGGLRTIKGTALTTFDLTTPPTAITNTSLLLNFTNGGIIDNTAKNVLETVGNAQISTSVKKFGTGSIYLDGSDNIIIPNSENFQIRDGNFTIELWYYPQSLSTVNSHILDFGDGLTSGQNSWNLGFFGSGNTTLLGFLWTYNGSSENKIQDTSALSTGQWYHIAVVKNGTSLVLYKNGTSVASTTLSGGIATSNRPLILGSNSSLSSGYSNGYIDDLRITKGVARYTTTFTPQTSQWQDQ